MSTKLPALIVALAALAWSPYAHAYLSESYTTDEVSEGSANLYFLDSRAKAACVSNTITNGVSDVAPSQDAVFDALALKADVSSVPTTTDALAEGSSNLYFTTARTKAALPQLSVYHVDKAGADSSTCGAISRPCLTISQALTNIGNGASLADLKSPKTVMIGGGVYDEDLTIPRGRIMTLVAQGTVILGNGSGSNWSSTNSRNVTATWNNADAFSGDIKPALNIVAMPGSDSTSTFIAEAGTFRISGNLVIAGDGLSNTLNLSSVEIDGQLNQTTAGLINWQGYRLLVKGTVGMGTSAVLERCDHCQFDALLTVNAINAMRESEVKAGITVSTVQSNMPPNGFFNTTITGTFTGPVSSARFDDTTDYFFRINNGTLGGSATKVLIRDTQTQTSVSGSRPTCTSSRRGMVWNVDGGTGVADSLQICQKDATDSYVWVTH